VIERFDSQFLYVIRTVNKQFLFFGNSTYRATASAGTAADAAVGINFELSIAFADSAYRTLSCTCTTRNTSVTNYICHDPILLKDINNVIDILLSIS